MTNRAGSGSVKVSSCHMTAHLTQKWERGSQWTAQSAYVPTTCKSWGFPVCYATQFLWNTTANANNNWVQQGCYFILVNIFCYLWRGSTENYCNISTELWNLLYYSYNIQFLIPRRYTWKDKTDIILSLYHQQTPWRGQIWLWRYPTNKYKSIIRRTNKNVWSESISVEHVFLIC